MKGLISYTDWLLLTRGKLRPEIGDTFICRFTDEIFKISTERDLVAVSWSLNMGKSDYLIELEFPTIKWDKVGAITYRGCVGNIDALTIHKNEELGVHELSFNDGALMFEGSLTECKQKANNLLYGL